MNEVKGNDVVCAVKNSATLAGSLFTLHASQIRIELPTLTDKDKQVCVGKKGMYVLCFLYLMLCWKVFKILNHGFVAFLLGCNNDKDCASKRN